MTKMSTKAQAAWEDYLRNYDGLITEDQAEQNYRDWLDDLSEEVKIGSLSWAASYVLEQLDPVAFRCGFSDYTSSEGLEEIMVDGKLFYCDKSKDDLLDDLLDDFKSNECGQCAYCETYCLRDELTADDPEDGFSEMACPDCVADGQDS